MEKIKLPGFKLIGLKPGKKTTNEGGQSAIDCGNLWQRFEKENVAADIAGKLSDEIYAVYFDYEGDHTQPFDYFIGCKVSADTEVPKGMSSLIIPGNSYEKLVAKGEMPDCVANTWREIWNSEIARQYSYDFEIYGVRSKDWNNAEVEIFISSGSPAS